MTRLAWLMLLLSGLLSLASRAEARVERFAVIVGNNRGVPNDVELRYAEADARKVAEVLQELGGVEPANTALLSGQTADALRRTLITVNDRIRTAVSEPNTDVVLFVYYSGHADAESLHLGNTLFHTAELAQLVRGSAATFRLLVVDACRSGLLTRTKGGKVRPPFPLDQDAQLSGQGLAFLTASSADEDAQESDELRGSFFTHALVSGLLGAADGDSDGSVVLEEAYRYAYDATLRSTSRTAYGTQHPTFQYDLRGQGQLVLTEPRFARAQRGSLKIGAGLDALVFQGGEDGPVVAEVTPAARARVLNLSPGKYFVRVRTDAYLLQGVVTVWPGAEAHVDQTQLSRIEYARLVRKGVPEQTSVHGLELGGRLRTALPTADTVCVGAVFGYRLDFARASLGTRVGYGESRFENSVVEARVREVDLSVRVGHAWDTPLLTFELGAGGGGVLFIQSFEAAGRTPPRHSLNGYASAFAALLHELKHGVYFGLDLEAQLYVLSLSDKASSQSAAFAGRGTFATGKHF